MNYKGIKDRVYNCHHCGEDFQRTTYAKKPPKYCSIRCQHDERMLVSETRFASGGVLDSVAQRRILTKQFGYQCVICNQYEWQGKPLTLQVDHIDGNPGNNTGANLRLLCPNCHSQTPTYKGGNKKNPKKDERSSKARNAYARRKVGPSE